VFYQVVKFDISFAPNGTIFCWSAEIGDENGTKTLRGKCESPNRTTISIEDGHTFSYFVNGIYKTSFASSHNASISDRVGFLAAQSTKSGLFRSERGVGSAIVAPDLQSLISSDLQPFIDGAITPSSYNQWYYLNVL